MAFLSETLALPENAFLLLRDLIMEKTGIYFEENRRDILADKLSNRVLERGFNSFLDYYYLLKYDPDSDEEWNVVFDLITVKETYFWRESDHLEAMIKYILPEYSKSHPGSIFRIWCAACATGEEPLSILMALHRSGWLGRLKFELLATDASGEALDKARKGIYRERSFRALPDDLRKQFFTVDGEKWKINPSIHKLVTWRKLNLRNIEDWSSVPVQNVIFCRNAFIYFREDGIKMITGNFFEWLTSPGYLFVGAAESLFRIKTAFELTEIGNTFVYKKS